VAVPHKAGATKAGSNRTKTILCLRTGRQTGAERRMAGSPSRQLTSRELLIAPGANTFALALGRDAGGVRREPHLRPQRLCSR
jgi:hypothetical protein